MPRPSVIAALACALLLAGCGSDDNEPTRAATAHLRAGQPLRVAADEYLFAPKKVVVSTGGGGAARLRIDLDNRGALAHNLKILRGDEELGGTSTIPGGRRAHASLSLVPGEYTMICTVGNHAELGMVGDLEVRAAGG